MGGGVPTDGSDIGAGEETATPSREEWSKERKDDGFEVNFRDTPARGGEEGDANYVDATEIEVRDDTLHLTYNMKNPENSTVLRYERQAFLASWTVEVAAFTMGEYGYNGTSFVSEYMNVTAVAPNGEVYETGSMNSTQAMRSHNDEINGAHVYFAYLRSTENGPVYDDYND